MRCKQGVSLTPLDNAWVPDDFLKSSLVGKTEVTYVTLQLVITNNSGGAIESATVLDAIDVRLTRDGSKRLVDCSMLDLHKLEVLKNRNSNNNISSIPNAGTKSVCVVIPFCDYSRPNPMDTALVVDTVKSLFLEVRYNAIAGVTLSTIETMIHFEVAQSSLRITSDRYLRKQGVNIGGAVPKYPIPVDSQLYSLAWIYSAANFANLSLVDIFGGSDILYTGEPDDINYGAASALGLDFNDVPVDSTGTLITDNTLILPIINRMDGYGKGKAMPITANLTTSGAFNASIFTDSITPPSPSRVERQLKRVLPHKDINRLMIKAVDKRGSKHGDPGKVGAMKIVPQFKVSEIGKTPEPAHPNTASANVEAKTVDSGAAD